MDNDFFNKYNISLKTLSGIMGNPDIIRELNKKGLKLPKFNSELLQDLKKLNPKLLKDSKINIDNIDKIFKKMVNISHENIPNYNELKISFMKKYEIDPEDIYLNINMDKYINSDIDFNIMCNKESNLNICKDYENIYNEYNITDFFSKLREFRSKLRRGVIFKESPIKRLNEIVENKWKDNPLYGHDQVLDDIHYY